ncbi:hypothetical protein GCM10010218_36710 [Streptomyces mashuensis]|uniref:Lipoprotein n=1 Tax=Streptomyces mashuensis TaxID=33904 RepID=A0A919B4C4_9ACTN|nr:hypothetical protein [Streptomyces mashuensis]GHF51725.1 hypothetical protein GCM10010218_36710 [Streptomyces mashuensis]
MRRRLTVLACALSLGASLLVTGCDLDDLNSLCGTDGPTPAGLTQADLVGTYEGHPWGTLTVRADGTFEVDDMPGRDMQDIADPRVVHLGARRGSWTLDGPLTIGDGRDRNKSIHLNGAGGFDISGTRERPVLYNFVGDPDMCRLIVLNKRP